VLLVLADTTQPGKLFHVTNVASTVAHQVDGMRIAKVLNCRWLSYMVLHSAPR